MDGPPAFSLPERGRYEPNATIFQKRKLEQFARSLHEALPERFYAIIDGMGRDQATYVIEFCQLQELAIANAAAERQLALEAAQRQRANWHLIWLLPLAIALVFGSFKFFSQGPTASKELPDRANTRTDEGLRPAIAPTPAVRTPVPPAFAADVKTSQAQAIRKYPALAVAGSAANQRFVARYKEWQARHDQRLDRSDWPERLADEVANSR